MPLSFNTRNENETAKCFLSKHQEVHRDHNTDVQPTKAMSSNEGRQQQVLTGREVQIRQQQFRQVNCIIFSEQLRSPCITAV